MARLTVERFTDLFEHTARRLETQPAYLVDYEQDSVAQFLAGEPGLVTDIPQYAEWLELIQSLAAEGRRVERVRVFEEPPTGYQRWLRWAGRWNVTAGEHIRYMTREQALAAGLPLTDWWLFDTTRLVKMAFDEDGRPLDSELVSDTAVVEQHRVWWDVAVGHSTPEQAR